MIQLKRLTPDAKDVVDIEFLRDDRTITESDLEDHLINVEAQADLDALGDSIDAAMEKHKKGRHEIEADLAPEVHKKIPITRRQASEIGIWHYLSIVWRPDFVRHRWPWEDGGRTETSMRQKFLGRPTDLYANAFHRMWWHAELTYDEEAEEDPYALTEKVANFQRLADWVFDPGFARYKPIVKVCAEALHDESTDIVNRTMPRVNHAVSTIPIEGQSEDELRAIVKQVEANVKEELS